MQVGIVAHIKRDEEAHALMDRVGGDVINVDNGEFFSIWECIRRCAENHITVLTRLHDLAIKDEWCVVLEDDSIPVPAFRTQAAAALACAPTPLVGLYLGQGNPSGDVQRNIRVALDAAQAWLTADFFIASVAYAIKANYIADLIDYIRPRDEELPLRITRWSQERGILTSYTRPSLIQHTDKDSVIYPDLPEAERRKMPRVAHEFGSRENWKTAAVRIANSANWSATMP